MRRSNKFCQSANVYNIFVSMSWSNILGNGKMVLYSYYLKLAWWHYLGNIYWVIHPLQYTMGLKDEHEAKYDNQLREEEVNLFYAMCVVP